MPTILFADNDMDFLNTRREYLEKQGFRVIPAINPEETRRILERGGIDLAILDIRLEDDDDEKDVSGLLLARELAQGIPKIILTNFPSYEYVREVLRPQLESLPPAVDFLAKQEGPEAMVRAIKKALEFANAWLRTTMDGITSQLALDYLEARQQAQINFRWSLAVAITGICVIFTGVLLAFNGNLALGIASAVSGLVTEAINYLFFERVNVANRRMDRYHTESLQTRRFENLLASCDEIASIGKREESKKKIIEVAVNFWFGVPKRKSRTASTSGPKALPSNN